ncbi:MAG: hypothetical protein QXV16_02770 [Candidatus Anstonellales archaeon]
MILKDLITQYSETRSSRAIASIIGARRVDEIKRNLIEAKLESYEIWKLNDILNSDLEIYRSMINPYDAGKVRSMIKKYLELIKEINITEQVARKIHLWMKLDSTIKNFENIDQQTARELMNYLSGAVNSLKNVNSRSGP